MNRIKKTLLFSLGALAGITLASAVGFPYEYALVYGIVGAAVVNVIFRNEVKRG